jgi:hypothetical protein
MAKCCWRLLVEDGSLWKKMLEAKYYGVERLSLSIDRRNKYSLLWNDVVDLGV